MRLVFAGTPATAVPSLDALLKSGHEVAAVVTRPDAPAGRGLRLAPSPVAQRAEAAGLEVLKPAKPGDPDFLDRLRQIAPDCCPVTAYGALIPQRALDVPPHGWVNLHFSLLPAWRGAAPVQHAILHGDDVTGATTFRIVAALDAGPVFGVVTEPIRPDETAGELLDRLAVSGAELLVADARRHRVRPAGGARAARRRGEPGAEDHRGGRAGALGRPGRRDQPPGSRVHAGARARGRCSNGARVKLWPFAGIGGDDQDLAARASCGCRARRRWSAPGPSRSSSATCSRTASAGCPPPTGRAASADAPARAGAVLG